MLRIYLGRLVSLDEWVAFAAVLHDMELEYLAQIRAGRELNVATAGLQFIDGLRTKVNAVAAEAGITDDVFRGCSAG